MQKLKMSFFHLLESLFTCFLKDKTLHNHWDYAGFTVPIITYQVITGNYSYFALLSEILLIITYQVITGNYSVLAEKFCKIEIITYQVITGNYSRKNIRILRMRIITYQVITGNYSVSVCSPTLPCIITYQVITGNYSYNVLWESSDNILKKYKWKRKSLAITPSDVNIFSQTSETLNGTAFKNIISCAKAAHDRHSPFAECINAFFSLALIISQSQKNNTLNKRDHI